MSKDQLQFGSRGLGNHAAGDTVTFNMNQNRIITVNETGTGTVGYQRGPDGGRRRNDDDDDDIQVQNLHDNQVNQININHNQQSYGDRMRNERGNIKSSARGAGGDSGSSSTGDELQRRGANAQNVNNQNQPQSPLMIRDRDDQDNGGTWQIQNLVVNQTQVQGRQLVATNTVANNNQNIASSTLSAGPQQQNSNNLNQQSQSQTQITSTSESSSTDDPQMQIDLEERRRGRSKGSRDGSSRQRLLERQERENSTNQNQMNNHHYHHHSNRDRDPYDLSAQYQDHFNPDGPGPSAGSRDSSKLSIGGSYHIKGGVRQGGDRRAKSTSRSQSSRSGNTNSPGRGSDVSQLSGSRDRGVLSNSNSKSNQNLNTQDSQSRSQLSQGPLNSTRDINETPIGVDNDNNTMQNDLNSLETRFSGGEPGLFSSDVTVETQGQQDNDSSIILDGTGESSTVHITSANNIQGNLNQILNHLNVKLNSSDNSGSNVNVENLNMNEETLNALLSQPEAQEILQEAGVRMKGCTSGDREDRDDESDNLQSDISTKFQVTNTNSLNEEDSINNCQDKIQGSQSGDSNIKNIDENLIGPRGQTQKQFSVDEVEFALHEDDSEIESQQGESKHSTDVDSDGNKIPSLLPSRKKQKNIFGGSINFHKLGGIDKKNKQVKVQDENQRLNSKMEKLSPESRTLSNFDHNPDTHEVVTDTTKQQCSSNANRIENCHNQTMPNDSISHKNQNLNRISAAESRPRSKPTSESESEKKKKAKSPRGYRESKQAQQQAIVQAKEWFNQRLPKHLIFGPRKFIPLMTLVALYLVVIGAMTFLVLHNYRLKEVQDSAENDNNIAIDLGFIVALFTWSSPIYGRYYIPKKLQKISYRLGDELDWENNAYSEAQYNQTQNEFNTITESNSNHIARKIQIGPYDRFSVFTYLFSSAANKTLYQKTQHDDQQSWDAQPNSESDPIIDQIDMLTWQSSSLQDLVSSFGELQDESNTDDIPNPPHLVAKIPLIKDIIDPLSKLVFESCLYPLQEHLYNGFWMLVDSEYRAKVRNDRTKVFKESRVKYEEIKRQKEYNISSDMSFNKGKDQMQQYNSGDMIMNDNYNTTTHFNTVSNKTQSDPDSHTQWMTPQPGPSKAMNGLQFLTQNGAENALVIVHFWMSAWGLGVLKLMQVRIGWWPLCTYTMVSWSLATMRWIIGFNLLTTRKVVNWLATNSLWVAFKGTVKTEKTDRKTSIIKGKPHWLSRMFFGSSFESPDDNLSIEEQLLALPRSATPAKELILKLRYYTPYIINLIWENIYVSIIERRILILISEGLRLPSIIQHIVTFTIWWIILVPIISLADIVVARKSPLPFLKWNFSLFLINVHSLNLILGLLDHILITPRPLGYLDLCCAFLIAVIYLTFYLVYLDANGIHFYIILNPRTNLAAISYVGIMKLYIGVFLWWR